MFRQLNDRELELFKRLVKRDKIHVMPTMKGLKVGYTRHANFTLCILLNGRLQWVGCAKRNPSDTWNGQVGEDVSLADAISHEPVTLR